MNFENFIEEFYKLDNKINLELDIENNLTPTIYDLHHMLLDLIIYGVKLFNLNLTENLNESLIFLQKYFNNININIIIKNLSKKELLIDEFYSNRYIRFEGNSDMIKNGLHEKTNLFNEIKSYYLINDEYNLCINFNYK